MKAKEPVILRAQGLKKIYHMGEEDLLVLKHVDLSLRHGEFVAIEGRSGSGKSTLLHILGGLDAPDGGTLEFQGTDYTPTRLIPKPIRWILSLAPMTRIITWSIFNALLVGYALYNWIPFGRVFIAEIAVLRLGLSLYFRWERRLFVYMCFWIAIDFFVCFHNHLIPAILVVAIAAVVAATIWVIVNYVSERPICRLRNTEFGFVFQFYHLLPELNVLENTLMSPLIENSWFGYFRRKRQLRERATTLLQDLGLGHRLRHKPNQLSGGERQRVAIARALMNKPKVLFADEPTGNLDYETGRQIMGVLERLHREQGQTIVMVTHDRTLARQADRVLVLRNGKLDRPDEDGAGDKAVVLDYGGRK